MHKLTTVSVPALVIGLGVGVGLATTPGPEGRVLPSNVKAAVIKYACDLPTQDWDVDCSANSDPTKCTWERTNGEKFEPKDDVLMHQVASNGFVWGVLSPTNEALTLGKYDADTAEESMSTFLFRTVAGMPVTEPDVYPTRLNPAAIAWAERELLPAPDQTMCGKHSAQEVYDRGFKRSTRAFVTALAQLAKAGTLSKPISIERLAKDNDQRRGGYWAQCQSIARANKATYDEGMLMESCRFWLRRGTGPDVPALAGFLARFLERYDPTFYAANSKALAKVLPKPTKAP